MSDPGAPLGVQEYNDPAAPKEFDIISGGAAMMQEMSGPEDKSRQAGRETLNGIPTQGSHNTDFNITCTSGGGK